MFQLFDATIFISDMAWSRNWTLLSLHSSMISYIVSYDWNNVIFMGANELLSLLIIEVIIQIGGVLAFMVMNPQMSITPSSSTLTS